MNFSVEKLRQMNIKDLEILSQDIRKEILKSVKHNGGHLASNLGVVELTIALHYVFNTPQDKIIFDVGHQCYAHKILTGRSFENLRQKGGVAGFPKFQESEFDTFNTGHASTSISLMSGLMKSKKILNKNYRVIAVIGDGAFCGGECFEALNNLKYIDEDCLIILNDNNMTISKSIGTVIDSDENLRNYLSSLEINYFGTIDGHNLDELIESFKLIKDRKGHNLIRIKTIKGKGFRKVENAPQDYHSYSVSNIPTFGKTVCNKLIEIKKKNNNVIAVTAAMTEGVGLRKFAECFPESLIDVGICEPHAVSMASGLAHAGLKPYVAIYSSFLQRAFDQIVTDVAIQNFPVTFLIDRSGFVDGDGDTHQGVYDINILTLPNFTVFSPANEKELEEAMELSLNINSPVAIRYTKYDFKEDYTIDNENSNIDILCTSNIMSILGKEVYNLLKEKGVRASVKTVFNLTEKKKYFKPILILEDSVSGSFYKSIDYKDKLGFYINKPISQGTIEDLLFDVFDKFEIVNKTIDFLNKK